MGWDIEEKPKKKSKSDGILKILSVSIIMVMILIGVLTALLFYVKMNTVVLSVDGQSKKYSSNFKHEHNGVAFYNIKELAGILGCDFHAGGEYKEYAKDDDKCYIVGENETASFYLNSDKISKLRKGEYTDNYKIFNCDYNTIKINDDFYAAKDAIEIAFGISFETEESNMKILTLPYIMQKIENKINPDEKNPVYNSLFEEDFENQKALLYGYIIACNKESELYSVKAIDAEKEIISDKYKKIEFIEETTEFLVTNNINKVGIIGEDGANKIEQIYDSIKLINTEPKMYLVSNNEKYGVIDENGKAIVHTEYNSIGIDITKYTNFQNQYILLNKVIPVEKDNKYGLFSVDGEKILDVNYDGIGCEEKTITINKTDKSVIPVIEIEECNGIVVKSGENYDLFLLDTNQLVSLKVKNIYSIKDGGKTEYYMLYKEQEMNLIENLIKLGYMKEESVGTTEKAPEENNNTSTENTTTNETNTSNTKEVVPPANKSVGM